MAWPGDVLASQALALSAGFTCNCPELPETARRDLREIGPTILIAPPSIWESMLADMEARGAQATPLKRTLFAYFGGFAERAERQREAGGSLPVLVHLTAVLGDALIYSPMRDQLGLRRLRWASAGGEAVSPRVLRRLRGFGIKLRQSDRMPILAAATRVTAHA
jgi:long-chain acyl-CoA synthetase